MRFATQRLQPFFKDSEILMNGIDSLMMKRIALTSSLHHIFKAGYQQMVQIYKARPVELLGNAIPIIIRKDRKQSPVTKATDVNYKAKQDYENKLRGLKERMETKDSLLNEQLEKQKVL
ncbi:hypothetical protein RO3G_12387 [Rhizopus delemar RA 99-880]|uniref:Uncharacterized protein n=1 Tax=Rhizopus delemar (strain RA 99-880 / ATCC MYA-4621 / FGSC 9543 / NRRL 43880) TaxID=246409 RepID=I1CGU6_RHIO9|nr:hypothetical protein RO3G_12387 [Rhizopus delemar RA 99-880]|eukprot:EIE87676.1 hypothetical protein RO3G_12387 [Rhizopus delemar RA 99-880]